MFSTPICMYVGQPAEQAVESKVTKQNSIIRAKFFLSHTEDKVH